MSCKKDQLPMTNSQWPNRRFSSCHSRENSKLQTISWLLFGLSVFCNDFMNYVNHKSAKKLRFFPPFELYVCARLCLQQHWKLKNWNHYFWIKNEIYFVKEFDLFLIRKQEGNFEQTTDLKEIPKPRFIYICCRSCQARTHPSNSVGYLNVAGLQWEKNKT